MLILDKFQIARIVETKLGVTLHVNEFERCEFVLSCPGGGGRPIITVTGCGCHEVGGDFDFEVRGRVSTDRDGLYFDWSDETRANWDAPPKAPLTKAQLKAAVVSRFTPEALDEYVLDMKGNEASDINNGGVEDQFDYLAETAGTSWIQDTLLKDKK